MSAYDDLRAHDCHDAEIEVLNICKGDTGWLVNIQINIEGASFNINFGHIEYIMVCGLGMISDECQIDSIVSRPMSEDMRRDLNIPNDGLVHRIDLSGGSSLMIVSKDFNLVPVEL